MRLEISPLAEFDLETIGDYIAQDSPVNAVRFVEGWRVQC
jgi:toxin ParE1/3/4